MFKLPRINRDVAIVDPATGKATISFSRFWNDTMLAIEQNDNQQNNLLNQLQAQLALINEALTLANIAIGLSGGNSGEATATIASLSTVFTNGPQVDLTGVIAGDLTIPGSGLTPISGTTYQNFENIDGFVQLVEIDTMVETVIGGPWAFSSYRDPLLGTIYITNAPEINAFLATLTTTGDLGYRLDYRLSEPGFILTDVGARMFARRTT